MRRLDDEEDLLAAQLPTPAADYHPPAIKSEAKQPEREVVDLDSSPEPEEQDIKPGSNAQSETNSQQAGLLDRERSEQVMQEESSDEDDMQFELTQLKLQIRQNELEHSLRKKRETG